MPVKIIRKEFVMPKRDWTLMSQSQKFDFLNSRGFDIYKKLYITEQQDKWNYSKIIKISQDFTEEYATEYENYYPKFYESKFELKEELKGLQVIKFDT